MTTVEKPTKFGLALYAWDSRLHKTLLWYRVPEFPLLSRVQKILDTD
jgi:hypothetical protein